jgi:hypothetical protein
MQRNSFRISAIATAIGLGLLAAGFVANASAATLGADGRGGAMPGEWRDYARASITPDFSWAERPAVQAAPSVLDRYPLGGDARQLLKLALNQRSALSVSFSSGRATDMPGVSAPGRVGNFTLPQPGIERTVVAPSVQFGIGETSALHVSAVFAYQRFASLGMGVSEAQYLPASAFIAGNSSWGAGARADFSGAIGNRLGWTIGYQSRIAMSPLDNYRGVFAEPGKFDIPASANIGLRYALTPSFGIDLGAERIRYSGITPFTSAALPTRFLALLGDGASPSFRWQDLDVYSVGWSYRSRGAGEFRMQMSTRQQPEPTSPLLASVLEPYMAERTYSLGWARTVGRGSYFNILATYASSAYFLGLLPAEHADSAANASRFEFQALWATRF